MSRGGAASSPNESASRATSLRIRSKSIWVAIATLLERGDLSSDFIISPHGTAWAQLGHIENHRPGEEHDITNWSLCNNWQELSIQTESGLTVLYHLSRKRVRRKGSRVRI